MSTSPTTDYQVLRSRIWQTVVAVPEYRSCLRLINEKCDRTRAGWTGPRDAVEEKLVVWRYDRLDKFKTMLSDLVRTSLGRNCPPGFVTDVDAILTHGNEGRLGAVFVSTYKLGRDGPSTKKLMEMCAEKEVPGLLMRSLGPLSKICHANIDAVGVLKDHEAEYPQLLSLAKEIAEVYYPN